MRGLVWALAVAASPAPAAAMEGVSLRLEERYVAGTDDVSQLSLGMLGAGVRLRLAPTLDVRASALALLTAGSAELGEPAPGGLGGELGVFIVPWPRWRVRPYVFMGAGLVFFSPEPFLPGGDVYDFVLNSGLGAELSLDERIALDLNAFAVHVSNGQGLVAHNPSYDGYGIGGALEYSFEPRRELASPWPRVAERSATRARWMPGVTFDANAGDAGGADYYSARARAAARLASPLLLVLDAEAGSIVDVAFSEVGLALVGHLGAASLGAHGGYRRFAGVGIAIAAAQAELHPTPEVSFVTWAHHERSAAFGEAFRAALGGRVFPLRSLVLDFGMGFERADDSGGAFAGDDVDPYVGAEWAAPLASNVWQLSVFAEHQVSRLDLAGVRVAYGMGGTPRDAARREGFRRLR